MRSSMNAPLTPLLYKPPSYRPGAFSCAPPAGAGGRALLCRVAVETPHAASSIAFHRPSNLREIEPSHATQPLHGNLLLAIGTLDGFWAHAEFRRQFLYREQLLLHAQSFLSVQLSTALTIPV